MKQRQSKSSTYVQSIIPVSWRNRIVGSGTATPEDLLANPYNWRIHPTAQQDALYGVLNEVGWVQDVLVNITTGMLIDGHLRVLLALRHHQPTVPVKYVELTEAQEAIILATLDPIAALAGSDREKLAALLPEVRTRNAAVQQLLTDLAQAAGVASAPAPVQEVEVALERGNRLRKQYGVDVGQLWACGRHRILCGDCLDAAQIDRLLAGQTPAMVWADPPYGKSSVGKEGYVGVHRAVQRSRHNFNKSGTTLRIEVYPPVSGDESPDRAIEAVRWFLHHVPDAIHVWWGGNYYSEALPSSSCWLVWNKETGGMHFADCELAWTNKQQPVRMFTHRWHGLLRDSERERRWHPTQKPAALAAWAYDLLGSPGDLVLDPFLGSGPSLLAAEQRNRTCYGIELSPEYVAVCLERWHLLTGQTPTLLTEQPDTPIATS